MLARDIARIRVRDVEHGVRDVGRAVLVVRALEREKDQLASRREAVDQVAHALDVGAIDALRASCTQPAFRKKSLRAYWPGLSRLSVAGLTKMPLPESPVPMRCEWLSQHCAGSMPPQAARTSSCSASRRGSRAWQGFQNPCSGQ